MVKYDRAGSDHYFSDFFDHFKKLEDHIDISILNVPGCDDFDLNINSHQYSYYQFNSWLDVLRSLSHILFISPISGRNFGEKLVFVSPIQVAGSSLGGYCSGNIDTQNSASSDNQQCSPHDS